MTNYDPEAEERTDLDDRDVRALTEYLTVLENQGRVRGADDLYEVVSASGRSYLVDAREATCECPDHEYRGVHCKHQKRVEFATGERTIPEGVDGVDPQLGEHVSTTSQAVATDGGQVLEESDDDTPGYTTHVEPEGQGGAEFARCRECGREILTSIGVDLLAHADGCANGGSEAGEGDGRQEPQRSEPADFGGGESTGAVDLL